MLAFDGAVPIMTEGTKKSDVLLVYHKGLCKRNLEAKGKEEQKKVSKGYMINKSCLSLKTFILLNMPLSTLAEGLASVAVSFSEGGVSVSLIM